MGSEKRARSPWTETLAQLKGTLAPRPSPSAPVSQPQRGVQTGTHPGTQIGAHPGGRNAPPGARGSVRPPPPVATEPPADSSSTAAEVLFRSAVHDAKPLRGRRDRVEPPKREAPATPDEEALAVAELQRIVSGEAPFHVECSEEYEWGSAPGVNREFVDALMAGMLPFRLHLDLHGFRQDDARLALQDFIQSARLSGHRCVLVVTGRGLRSPGGHAVLRVAVPRWLQRAPTSNHVLAYATARRVDGGPGAYYVALRRLGRHGR